MIREIEVWGMARTSLSLSPVIERFGIEEKAFSGSINCEWTDEGGWASDHATEKGWLVQRPMLGIARKTCWFVLKVQGRAKCKVTLTASPGNISTVAFVFGREDRERLR